MPRDTVEAMRAKINATLREQHPQQQRRTPRTNALAAAAAASPALVGAKRAPFSPMALGEHVKAARASYHANTPADQVGSEYLSYAQKMLAIRNGAPLQDVYSPFPGWREKKQYMDDNISDNQRLKELNMPKPSSAHPHQHRCILATCVTQHVHPFSWIACLLP
jgi:hypothetical protein